ncbi:uncharacterized protein EAF01_007075 [Botrytis porri]|uniref:SAP domain-containing protein n=1 Tax=Botrytis porri TaxID=87229 RepID=A0A4Z1KXN0_9HELO|nr:uncharacterized protein EAF01_007075 [Botrytis porri]KAF7901776.1 hypothetical protein EAF01_007075 [Botrytis porri]TGO89304.1 hypothetical protein BPOR_0115g00090 [Botrytis porri]
MMVDYTKYRVVELKEVLKARQVSTNGLKAALVQRLTESDARHVSIEEVVNRKVTSDVTFTAPPTQSQIEVDNLKPGTLLHNMNTLKSIPGFTPTAAGNSMIGQENSYASAQSQSLQSAFPKNNYAQSLPDNSHNAVTFSENDFSDDDDIDLDTIYDLPMSQTSFTNSQPQSQPGAYRQNHMSPPTQAYSMMPPASSFQQGYRTMSQSQKSYPPATPTPRQPLADISINQMSPPSSAKVYQKPLVYAPYLTFYQLEQMYPNGQNFQDENAKLARRRWLAKLGIDVSPYYFVFINESQRNKVEIHWALKSQEERRDIEQKAVLLKSPYQLTHAVPLRLAPPALRTPVPINLIGPTPLSFYELEQTYFEIPQGKNLAYYDLVPKRLAWLESLGFDDLRYLPLAQSTRELQALNDLYDQKPRVERRAIEAKAKYINAKPNFPALSWETLEKDYEIYPESAFTTHTAYSDKRREWLQKLGLDVIPFCYKPAQLHEGNMQGMEIAWSEINEVERGRVLEKAKIIKEDSNPVVESWAEFEYTYGFTKEKDREFKNDPVGYSKKRGLWIIDIGLDVEPFKNVVSSSTALQAAWSAKPIEERKSIVNKAKWEKERFVRDLARKKAEKAGGNYKAPPTEVKKTSKRSFTTKSSNYKVSKSYTYGKYSFGGYHGRSYSSGYESGYGRNRYSRY